MKNISTHTGKLQIERVKSSVNGNPRFICRLTTDAGIRITFYTAPDSSLGYSIQNYDGKRVEADIGRHYNRLTLDSIQSAV